MRFQLPKVVAIVRHPHHHPLELSYLNGFSYGIGMSMLSLLVPLYIIRLGFSLADIHGEDFLTGGGVDDDTMEQIQLIPRQADDVYRADRASDFAHLNDDR